MLTGKGDAKKMELGRQIKKYRGELNLSQEELADKIFVSRQTVSNWENDKNYPDIKSLILMSEVFGVSLDILVKGDIETMKKMINETEVKKFLISKLNHGVTVMDARGGYTGNVVKMIMCVVPTKEYMVVKQGILEIDENALIMVSDVYEVVGNK